MGHHLWPTGGLVERGCLTPLQLVYTMAPADRVVFNISNSIYQVLLCDIDNLCTYISKVGDLSQG